MLGVLVLVPHVLRVHLGTKVPKTFLAKRKLVVNRIHLSEVRTVKKLQFGFGFRLWRVRVSNQYFQPGS